MSCSFVAGVDVLRRCKKRVGGRCSRSQLKRAIYAVSSKDFDPAHDGKPRRVRGGRVIVSQAVQSPAVPERRSNWFKNSSLGLCFGFLAGMIGALIGLGGAVILTPLLTGVMGVGQHVAHGTSLIAVAFTSFVGSISYFQKGALEPPVAILIATVAVFSARFASKYAQQVKETNLKKYFAYYLMFAACFLALKPMMTELFLTQEGILDAGMTAARTAVTSVLGLVTGLVSGLLGVGGGTIMVPGLTYFLGFPQVTAQGTSLASAIAPSIIGAFTYVSSGNVRASLLFGIVPGVSLGSFVGSKLAVTLSDEVLRICCASVLFFSGFRTLLQLRPKASDSKIQAVSEPNSTGEGVTMVPEEGFIFQEECKIHYKYLNQDVSGKTPLVLLHMAPRSMDEYNEFVAYANGSEDLRRPFILFDLPGYGDSARLAPLSMVALTKQLNAGLDSLGISGQVDVAGHLIGALAAVTMSAEFPERMRKMTLIDPVYMDEEARTKVAAWGASDPKLEIDAKGDFLTSVWNKRAAYVEPELNYRCVFDELRAKDTEHTCTYSVSKTPMDEALGKMTAPSLVIWSLKMLQIFNSLGWKVIENRPKVDELKNVVDVLEVDDGYIDGLCSKPETYADLVFSFHDSE